MKTDTPRIAPEYCLQVKANGSWRTLYHHEDEEYLEAIYLKHFTRHEKHRILKIK